MSIDRYMHQKQRNNKNAPNGHQTVEIISSPQKEVKDEIGWLTFVGRVTR